MVYANINLFLRSNKKNTSEIPFLTSFSRIFEIFSNSKNYRVASYSKIVTPLRLSIVSKPVRISDWNLNRSFIGPILSYNYENFCSELLPNHAIGQKKNVCWNVLRPMLESMIWKVIRWRKNCKRINYFLAFVHGTV